MLCSLCQGIFEKVPHVEGSAVPWYPHYEKSTLLISSAQAGCHLCLLVSQAHECSMATIPTFDSTETKFEYITIKKNGSNDYIIVFLFGRRNYVFNCDYQSREQLEKLNTDLSVNISCKTGLGSSWEALCNWIKICDSNHVQCSSGIYPNWRPTRLIHIDHGASESTIRLCDTVDLPQNARYTSLSHCWGRTQTLMLTMEKYPVFKRGIPMNELSRTFLDAIDITKRLSISYIWIDSLCIIQDSTVDWEQEAAEMKNVYSRSYLNIAATAAENGTGGCYQDRNPLLTRPCIVEFKGAFKPGRYHVYLSPKKWVEVAQSPLLQRAWVVQELFLAPRTVHFTKSEIFWECREIHASESAPVGSYLEKDDLQYRDTIYDEVEYPRYITEKPSEPTTKFNHRQWESVVRRYTQAKLTFQSDKLVALSGIAKEFQSKFRVKYHAGLWEEDLINQLTWIKLAPVLVLRSYRAPSWSWASLDGKVTSIWPDNTHQAKVLEIETQLSTSDPTGAVSGGFIRLVGRLKTVCWSEIQPNSKRFRLDNPLDDFGNDWQCMPLSYSRKMIHGLLLKPTGCLKGEFRRVGRFNCEKEDLDKWTSDLDLNYESKATPEQRFTPKPEDDFSPDDEIFWADQYIISVV